MLNTQERQDRARPRGRAKVSDEARFFRGWLQRPLVMGAVSPSSRSLGRAMAGYVPDPETIDSSACVLELGPGTGVVTQCLIDAGIPESALVLVEFSPEFCVLLKARFPSARVIEGDAYTPNRETEKAIEGRKLRAVVSSLPLFTKPDRKREAVVGGALRKMPHGAPFIQFSYALTVPIKPALIGAELKTSPWIKRNLPPARVLVYRSV